MLGDEATPRPVHLIQTSLAMMGSPVRHNAAWRVSQAQEGTWINSLLLELYLPLPSVLVWRACFLGCNISTCRCQHV